MIPFDISVKDEVESTNTCIKELMAEGAPEGTVVIARRQVGGYGRRGHAWKSPEGGLYLSVLLRPVLHESGQGEAAAAKLPTLSLVTALAVRRGICALMADQAAPLVKVKWPNDVLVEQDKGLAKLCGISLEGSPRGLCLGIGVNVLLPECDGEGPFASVAGLPGGEGVSLQAVARSVLSELGADYELWLAHSFDAFLEEYNGVSALAGRWVQVSCGDDLVEGCCVGVDGGGRMLLRRSDGAIRPIVSGEAHIERLV